MTKEKDMEPNDKTDDVVVAMKARWARALGLKDETMAIAALEKATRKQRQAMEDAMAADLAHTEAHRRERKRADEHKRESKLWRKWAMGILKPDTIDGETDDEFLRGWLAARLKAAEDDLEAAEAQQQQERPWLTGVPPGSGRYEVEGMGTQWVSVAGGAVTGVGPEAWIAAPLVELGMSIPPRAGLTLFRWRDLPQDWSSMDRWDAERVADERRMYGEWQEKAVRDALDARPDENTVEAALRVWNRLVEVEHRLAGLEK
jgi:hypothetical protein